MRLFYMFFGILLIPCAYVAYKQEDYLWVALDLICSYANFYFYFEAVDKLKDEK
jgi:hypothetical protein